MAIVIRALDGYCPVQGHGTIDGEPFYFRARGNRWSIEIGPGNTHLVVEAMGFGEHGRITDKDAGDAVRALGCWYYEEPYKEDDKFAAGYMTMLEARTFIEKGAEIWRTSGVP